VGLALAGAAGLAFAAAHPPDEADGLGASPSDEVPALARSLAALRPADFVPHATAGARLAEAGRCRDAMPWLVRAMWLAPAMPAPHRWAAGCLAAAGEDTFARREYRLAFTLGDGAALAEAAARWSGADALAELVPETAEALSLLAGLLDGAGRRPEAAAVLRRGWEGLSDPDLLFRLGRLTAREEPERALEIARELRSREPDRPRGHVLAAEARARLGDGQGALRELEEGLARFPGAPELVLATGAELIRQRRFATAAQLLASIHHGTPSDAARARDMRITALRAQGRLPEAVAEARAARELDPRNVAASLRLADLLAQARLFDEAIGVLSAAASLPGGDEGAIAARLEKVRAAARTRADPGAPASLDAP
jgi:tetratricopeptide (TPR) repeat protein